MKNKLSTYVTVAVFICLSMMNLVTKDGDVSMSERRKLQQFPKINLKDFFSKKMMDDFEVYAVDQFIFRDAFKKLQVNSSQILFNQLDNHDVYVWHDSIFKKEKGLNEKSLENFSARINNITGHLNDGQKAYYAMIPQKETFVESKWYQTVDYTKMMKIIDSNILANKIDLNAYLTLNDYYKTDTHWKQENILELSKHLVESMGVSYVDDQYTKQVIDPFYGVYYNQASLKDDHDKIIYLTSDKLDMLQVDYLEDDLSDSVYTPDKKFSLDQYDVFLNGAMALVEINNPNALNDEELLLFRDSFGSSIAPLLAQSYKKITLIDLRYITSDKVFEMIDFKDQDVLFLYSTLIANNSGSLK